MEQVDKPSEGRGRSAKKREAKAVEQLAQLLADLPDAEIARLELSPDLGIELQRARDTRGHSSRKRQIKHLAGVLRRHDEQRQRLERTLEDFNQVQRQNIHSFHNLEILRDRLCSADDFQAALEDTLERYPHIDAGKLSGLARSVHASNDKKASREIFRRLRKEEEDGSAG